MSDLSMLPMFISYFSFSSYAFGNLLFASIIIGCLRPLGCYIIVTGCFSQAFLPLTSSKSNQMKTSLWVRFSRNPLVRSNNGCSLVLNLWGSSNSVLTLPMAARLQVFNMEHDDAVVYLFFYVFFVLFCFVFLFTATPVACGSSQDKESNWSCNWAWDTKATATLDSCHFCNLWCSLWQCWILNPLREASNQTHSLT